MGTRADGDPTLAQPENTFGYYSALRNSLKCQQGLREEGAGDGTSV